MIEVVLMRHMMGDARMWRDVSAALARPWCRWGLMTAFAQAIGAASCTP